MYRSFAAQGYRGLCQVSLTDLARINLVSGRNDVGKTTLLEAVFLHACGPFAGSNALQILRPLRGQQSIDMTTRNPASTDSPWASFFEGLDISKDIELESNYRDREGPAKKSRLRLSVPQGEATSQIAVGASDGTGTLFSAALDTEYIRDENKSDKNRLIISLQGSETAGSLGSVTQLSVNMRFDPPPAPDLMTRATFLNGHDTGNDLATAYSELRQKKINIDLVDAMRGLDERIRGLEVLVTEGRPQIHVTLDDGLVLPLSLLGDGPVLLAKYVLSMLSVQKGGILLIDEVETGIHWEALQHMWKVIHRAAERLDVQVMATTHSRECLIAAARALSGRPNELMLYRLGPRNKDGSLHVATYDQDKLDAGIDMNLDLR